MKAFLVSLISAPLLLIAPLGFASHSNLGPDEVCMAEGQDYGSYADDQTTAVEVIRSLMDIVEVADVDTKDGRLIISKVNKTLRKLLKDLKSIEEGGAYVERPVHVIFAGPEPL